METRRSLAVVTQFGDQRALCLIKSLVGKKGPMTGFLREHNLIYLSLETQVVISYRYCQFCLVFEVGAVTPWTSKIVLGGGRPLSVLGG